jgi:phosphoribosylanthranilate isomerase
MTRIKICGITNLSDALTAVELGADAVGFIFAESPRQVDMETAREIIKSLPPFLSRVGVFVNEKPEDIQSTVKYCGLTMVQLHGNESPSYLKALDLPFIKAFRVHDHSILEHLREYKLSHFLLDTYVGNQAGGTGKSFDWEIAQKAGRLGKVILGGGLNNDNIENALDMVHPFAVDVSSGVEAYPGKKDTHKLEAFIRKVKAWDNQIN